MNYITIAEQDAEVLLEVLHEYPQNIRWTIKGVSVDELRSKLANQLKLIRETNVTVHKS